MRNTENPITNDIASKAFIPATSFLFCIRDAEMTYHPITSFNPLKICIELTLFYHLYFAIKPAEIRCFQGLHGFCILFSVTRENKKHLTFFKVKCP